MVADSETPRCTRCSDTGYVGRRELGVSCSGCTIATDEEMRAAGEFPADSETVDRQLVEMVGSRLIELAKMDEPLADLGRSAIAPLVESLGFGEWEDHERALESALVSSGMCLMLTEMLGVSADAVRQTAASRARERWGSSGSVRGKEDRTKPPQGYTVTQPECAMCDGSGTYPSWHAPIEQQDACDACPDKGNKEDESWVVDAVLPDGNSYDQGPDTYAKSVAACWAHRDFVRSSSGSGLGPEVVRGGARQWAEGERDAVEMAVFGKVGGCANLGPYVQSLVDELNELRDAGPKPLPGGHTDARDAITEGVFLDAEIDAQVRGPKDGDSRQCPSCGMLFGRHQPSCTRVRGGASEAAGPAYFVRESTGRWGIIIDGHEYACGATNYVAAAQGFCLAHRDAVLASAGSAPLVRGLPEGESDADA